MAIWVYKCNTSKSRVRQDILGDWDVFFEERGKCSWGSTEWIPALQKLCPGDLILAYQTNRKKLVSLAKVKQLNTTALS